MKMSGVRALIVCGALLCAPMSAAQDTPVIDNVFFQSDLRQAIEDVAGQAGVNIIADPTVQGVVSVTIENSTIERALDLLLAGTEFQVQRTPDYYLVYSADASSDLLTEVSETRVVKLLHVSPEAARSLLPGPLQQYVRFETGSSTRLAVTAPRNILSRILADLEQIDQGNGDTIFVTLQHIAAEQARGLLPENLQVFARVDPGRNIIAVTAPERASSVIVSHLTRVDTPGPALSLDAANVFQTQIVKLNHVTAESMLNLLPNSVTEYVRADAVSNAISISAPDHIAARIMSNVRTVDVPRRHIMLEARIVVLDRSDVLNFGGALQTPTVTAGFNSSTAVGAQYDISVGYLQTRTFTNALNLTLNLLSQNDEATIVASPKVLAQDGIPAEIKVTTEEYIQITSETNGVSRGQLEQIETGTILSITPQVGLNGAMTLDMNLEVSDVISRGAQGLPVVSRRTAKSTVQLQSGGTAAVAGLVDTRTQTGSAGLPGSQQLPFLGRAVRTDSLKHNARQVAIFVTATLVDANGNRLDGSQARGQRATAVDEDEYRAELRFALTELGVAVE
jgi:type II secretory pathway component GspD/PulD (secretin)